MASKRKCWFSISKSSGTQERQASTGEGLPSCHRLKFLDEWTNYVTYATPRRALQPPGCWQRREAKACMRLQMHRVRAAFGVWLHRLLNDARWVVSNGRWTPQQAGSRAATDNKEEVYHNRTTYPVYMCCTDPIASPKNTPASKLGRWLSVSQFEQHHEMDA